MCIYLILLTLIKNFRFKRVHSTRLCSKALEETVQYHTQRNSNVFAFFVDSSKAVIESTIANRLLEDSVVPNVVSIIAFW
jgi:hypothetical protein